MLTIVFELLDLNGFSNFRLFFMGDFRGFRLSKRREEIGFEKANLILRTPETVSIGCSRETKLCFATLKITTQSGYNLQWVVLMIEILACREDRLRLTLHSEMEIIHSPKV